MEIKELAKLMQRVVGHEGESRWDSDKPDGTPRKLMDVSRMTKMGWRAKIGGQFYLMVVGAQGAG